MEPAEPVNVVADNLQPGPGIGKQRRRRTLPKAVAFWILAGLFLILFFASSAASPLYRVYQAQFHFSADPCKASRPAWPAGRSGPR